jgi:transposase
MNETDQPKTEEYVLTAEDIAGLLKVNVATVRQWHHREMMPLPTGVGRPRWVRTEILAWVRAGCPRRAAWEEMRTREEG